MIIKSIYIEGIQSIHKPLKIDLDRKITRIAGRNTAGKSAIVKSMSLFAGVYSRNDIPGLISKQRPKGKESVVALLLEDGTSLWARIGNTSNVQYQRRGPTGEVMKVWEAWEEEIIKILGWQTVEKERLCLNIKKSKTNLFIDTASRTNGQIIDYLCEDKDMEIRIAHLEELEERLKTANRVSKTKIEFYTRKFDNKTEINLDAVERLYKKVSNIEFTKKVRENLKTLEDNKRLDFKIGKAELLDERIKILIYIKNQLQLIKVEENLNKVDKLALQLKSIKLITQKDIKNRTDNQLKSISTLEVYLKEHKDVRAVQRLEINKSELHHKDKNLVSLDKQIEKLKDLKDVTLGLDKITQTRNRNKIMGLDEDLTKIGELGSNLKLNNILRSISIAKQQGIRRELQYNLLENKVAMVNIANKLSDVVGDILINNITRETLDELYKILDENNVCPLCQSELDVDKVRGEIND